MEVDIEAVVERVMDDVARLHELLREGKCCASAIVQTALEINGGGNEQLVHAVSGLCVGVRSGLLCGALTGAACMMSMLDPRNANKEMIPELVEWFRSTYGREHGGINCADIIENDMSVRKLRCPAVIESTYLRAKRIMTDYGYDFGPEGD